MCKKRELSIGHSIKKIYTVISVISTLTIFSAGLLFLCGKIGLANYSDDDLIMKNIKKQIPNNMEITSIRTQDIHGFGNESIIVLASDYYMEEPQSAANQLLIFDKVENDILNQVYNLFGFGSNYKLSYMFSLQADSLTPYSWGYSLEIIDIIELTGDLSKELVVMFMPLPAGTSAYYEIGIFSYSFDSNSYYLLGTYPPSDKHIFKNNFYISYEPVETVFRSKDPTQYNLYDDSSYFELEWGTSDDNDFFIPNDYGLPHLVRTQMIWGENESHVSPHRHIISVFSPNYNPEKNELEWAITFSKETTEYTTYCTKEFVIDFLKENNRLDIVDSIYD